MSREREGEVDINSDSHNLGVVLPCFFLQSSKINSSPLRAGGGWGSLAAHNATPVRISCSFLFPRPADASPSACPCCVTELCDFHDISAIQFRPSPPSAGGVTLVMWFNRFLSIRYHPAPPPLPVVWRRFLALGACLVSSG